MVRVTHPPGGTPKLECEAAPSPKTVRVLKPPGGGSSISFGEDDVPVAKPQPKAPASTPAPSSSSSSSNGSESPQAETSPAPAAPEAPLSPSPSSPSSSNGTDTNGSAASPNTLLLVEQFPKININSSSNGDSNGSAAATNGINGTSEVNGTAAATNGSNGTTNGTSESNCNVKESGEVNGKANGAPEPKQCPAEALKGTPEPASNGNHAPSSPVSSPPPHSPEPQAATSSGKVTPATPSTPTSPGGCSPDTRDRLFGYHNVASKPHVARATPSNHHMRSSIFTGHDEDVRPSNGCSASSPTTAPPSQPKPQPQQQQQQPFVRVRQPPGGYSTKLW